MVARDVDVLVVVVDGSPVVDTGSIDDDDDVVVDAMDSVDVQAPRVSSVASATPRRNGGRLRPPNPIDQRPGLKWLPPFTDAEPTLRVRGRRGRGENIRIMSSRRYGALAAGQRDNPVISMSAALQLATAPPGLAITDIAMARPSHRTLSAECQ